MQQSENPETVKRLPAHASDVDVALEIVRKNGMNLAGAPANIKSNTLVVLGAFLQNYKALEHASPNLKANKDFMRAVVEDNGLALQYASKKVVLATVKQNGQALQHAPEALRGDRDVVLAAVCKSGYALQYVSKALKEYRDVVLAQLRIG